MGLTFKDGTSAKDALKKDKPKKKSSKSGKSKKSSAATSSEGTSNNSATVATKQKGAGHLQPSGTIVTGTATTFLTTLSVGDALLVQNPTTLLDEMRIVQFIVSETSMSLSSAFTFTSSSTLNYWFIKSPKAVKTAAEIAGDKERDFKLGTDCASGASSGNTVQIRVNDGHGSYKVITERVEEGTSREEMLGMRTKRKSDKFC